MPPAPPSDFVQMVCELLAPMGDVTVRRMFGGYGIYCDGVFFALVADEVLYFKVDDGNRADYETLGLRPFKPLDDKPVTLSYYPPPESALDEQDELLRWARLAFAAAVRAAVEKKPKRKRTALAAEN